MIYERTRDEIERDLYTRLQEHASITAPTGFARAIARFVVDATASMESRIGSVERWLPSSATGADLDEIGAVYGLTRNPAGTAADSTLANVRLYIDPAAGLVASDLLARMPGTPSAIVIPAGVEISGGTSRYRTTAEAVLAGSATEVFVAVRAASAGPAHNVATRGLVAHNLLTYPTLAPIARYLKVENRLPITGGTLLETDNNFRLRIYTAIRTIATGNLAAVQQVARDVPGVSDALIVPHIYGVGTTGILVQATSALTPPELIRRVSEAVAAVAPIGEEIVVIEPTYLGIELALDVTVAGNDREGIIAAARDTAIVYINSQPLGQSRLVVAELIARVMAVSGVRDVAITQLVVGTYDPLARRNTMRKSVAIRNFAGGADEKFYTNALLTSACASP